MSVTPIRVAVCGLGWVAQNRHIPALLRNPSFTVCGFMDHHEGRAESVADLYNVPLFFQGDNIADVPWLDEVDAFVIGAPPCVHARLALAALTRGKHVLTEKPFAMNADEALAMVRASKAHGRILAVVHNFQYSRAAKRLEKDMKAGKLGKIKRVAAMQLGNPLRRLPVWYERLPLGLFFDESPHFFYLLRKIVGQMTLLKAHVAASTEGKKTPALVHLLYRSESGVPVTVDCAFEGSLSEWFVRITGDKATAVLDIFRDIYIRLPNDGAHTAKDILRTSACAISQHLWSHLPNGIAFLRGRLDYGNDEVFARFAQAINAGKEPDGIGGSAALDVMEEQMRAVRALEENILS